MRCSLGDSARGPLNLLIMQTDVSQGTGVSGRGRTPAVLVTGAAGVIGPHLVRALVAEGRRVIALDDYSSGSVDNLQAWRSDDRVVVLDADVTDPIRLNEQVAEIYHLACPASPVHYQRDPIRTLRTNVEGSMNMLELARQHGARVLLASTSEVYGDPLVHPQHEGYWGNVNPIGVRACYDEGKRCAEAFFMSYQRQYGVETRIARIFNTYGPGMRPDDGRVISNFIVAALKNAPLVILGDGSQTRSFCYVTDLVAGLLALMGSSDTGPEPVNLGNPFETTVAELAEIVRRKTGTQASVEFRPLPLDDPRRRRPDITRASTLLGWVPSTPLELGLEVTINYFRGRI
jgi:UDP-glucuronate decarboxylase